MADTKKMGMGMMLLFLKTPAIVACDGRYITNFGLLVLAAALVIALVKAPVIFLGGSGVAGLLKALGVFRR